MRCGAVSQPQSAGCGFGHAEKHAAELNGALQSASERHLMGIVPVRGVLRARR